MVEKGKKLFRFFVILSLMLLQKPLNFVAKSLERGKIFNKKQRANAIENNLFTSWRFES